MFYYEKREYMRYKEVTRCEHCEGVGSVWTMTLEGFEQVECPVCRGRGKIVKIITTGEENA